jgi:hypothetical protein
MSPVALVHAAPTWMDNVLADSFPASDPPSWTPGIATSSISAPSAKERRDKASRPKQRSHAIQLSH